VAHNLQKLYKQHSNRHTAPDITTKSETRTINQIKKKLIDNDAMITKADKRNSIVILYIIDYNNKVDNFISSKNSTTSKMDITNRLQRDIRTTINEYQRIVPKDEKWRYIAPNPAAPNMRGLVKIHKVDAPIRPVNNWKYAPAYKVAKMLAKKLQVYTPLPYTFNVKNTTHLIEDLRLASFDITNM
jgi:hypothetical protein